MSSALLNMSLEQAIKQRKTTESKNKVGKARKNPMSKTKTTRKNSSNSNSKPNRLSSRRPSTKSNNTRRNGSTKPALNSKFIKRTGSGKASVTKKQVNSPKKVFSTKTNEVKQSPTKLKISNLDFNVTHNDLMELFSKMGSVVKNKIVFDELGRSKGKAFIEFDKPTSASAAIKEYNGVSLDGKTISVEYDQEKRSKTNVFKKNISKKPRRGSFDRDNSRRNRGETRRGDSRRRDGERKNFKPKGSNNRRPTHFKKNRKMIP